MHTRIQLHVRPLALLAACLPLGLGSCVDDANAGKTGSALQGTVAVDGSSTVFPITEAVAEEFGKVHRKVRVTVGVSGTGGGFKKFCIGTTVINDASRPIKQNEIELAEKSNIDYIELPVAYDGITIVVNKANTWADKLTVAELKKVWEPGSKIDNWSQIRAGFPDMKLSLYGPGVDSGTFDYFTKAINGKERACRTNFTASEDDNTLVNGVAGDKGALGFFGFAYYAENENKLRAVPVAIGDAAAVAPSLETINNGTYKPLSRPIFIYVALGAADRPEVKAFVEYYLDEAAKLVKDVGYVALPDSIYKAAKARFAGKVTGSLFTGKDVDGKTLEQIYN